METTGHAREDRAWRIRRKRRSRVLSRYAGRPLSLIWRYVARHKLAHGVLLLAILSATGCALASQLGIRNLIDALPSGHAHPQRVVYAFVVLVALIFSDNLLWRVGGWVSAHAFVAVTGDIRQDMFEYLAGHAPSYFADKQPGVLSSRITSMANAVYVLENALAWSTLSPALMVIGSIVMVSAVSVPMSLVLTAISAALTAALFVLARKGTAHHEHFAQQAASVDGELVDVVGNMGLVRAFGAEATERSRFDHYLNVETRARKHSLLYLERLRLMHALATVVLSGCVLGWTVWLWSVGRATTGDVVLISSLGFSILHGSRDVAVAFVDLTQYVARLGEATQTLLVPQALPEAPRAGTLTVKRATIDFENVSFAYPGRRPVLNGVSLHIEAGERVGLVGPSGAGKSTILMLLQHCYEPAAGRVCISGQDISQVTLSSLQDAMAIVPQDVSLFNRPLRDNLRYGRPDATDDEILRACELAQCLEFVNAFPQGLDTVVGDRGTKLSGGQRQRIGIARAILRDAPILLLDEATSALDTQSELAIQAALGRLMQGRTVVAIAHRLSTLQDFDRIVVLGRGRIVQEGSPSELAARPGVYRDMWMKQHRRAQALAA